MQKFLVVYFSWWEQLVWIAFSEDLWLNKGKDRAANLCLEPWVKIWIPDRMSTCTLQVLNPEFLVLQARGGLREFAFLTNSLVMLQYRFGTPRQRLLQHRASTWWRRIHSKLLTLMLVLRVGYFVFKHKFKKPIMFKDAPWLSNSPAVSEIV